MSEPLKLPLRVEKYWGNWFGTDAKDVVAFTAVNEAQAHQIVTAVNAYPALVEALELFANGDNWIVDHEEGEMHLCTYDGDAQSIAQSALEKAGPHE